MERRYISSVGWVFRISVVVYLFELEINEVAHFNRLSLEMLPLFIFQISIVLFISAIGYGNLDFAYIFEFSMVLVRIVEAATSILVVSLM